MTFPPSSQLGSPYVPAPQGSGVQFWGLGFLWFIPFLGALLAPILLGILAVQNRRNPDSLVRENSRWAANWVFTVTLLALIGNVIVFINLLVETATTGALESSSETTPLLAVANLVIWASWISHLVVSIVGVTRAKTRVVNPRIAIPFISALK